MEGREKKVGIKDLKQQTKIAPAPPALPMDKFSMIKNKRNVSFEPKGARGLTGDASTIIE